MAKNQAVDLRLAFPCTIQVSGYSQAGKSYLAAKIVKHRKRLFKKKVDKVIWLYSEMQPLYETLQQEESEITFTKDNQDVLDELESGEPVIVVLDDQTIQTLANNSSLLTFFVQSSHHKQAVFIWLTHAIFLPKCRLIQINSTYLVVFRMLRDSSSIYRLGYQLMPSSPKTIYEAYRYSVNKNSYSYIFFLFHPSDVAGTRIRTSLFFWEKDFEIIQTNGTNNEAF